MNKSGTAPRWFHAWRPRPAVEPEPADLGTAFGLDLSLMGAAESGWAQPEGLRRTSDEGLDGADDPRRAWSG